MKVNKINIQKVHKNKLYLGQILWKSIRLYKNVKTNLS